MRERLQRLLAERANIVSEQDAIMRQDNPTAEDMQRWDALDVDFRSKSEEIRRLEATLERSAAQDAIVPETRILPGSGESREALAEQYQDAWRTWARMGTLDMPAEQRATLVRGRADLPAEARALGIATGSIGGYLVPEGFLNVLEREMLYYAPLFGVAQVLRTSTGNPMVYPTLNDTSNKGRRIGDNTAVTQTDPTFGQKEIDAYVYSSDAVLAPYSLLQDSAFDIDGLLTDLLGERLGRIACEDQTAGTGAGEPEGIVTNISTGKTGATGQTATVTYDDLVDLEHSVDVAYRNERARWMMHDLSLAIVRKVKDGEGRPMFVTSTVVGQPDTLLGKPISINNEMAQMAANAKSILFGDFQRAFLIRIARDVTMVRATERWVDAMQVGFFAFMRWDSILKTTSAVKAYANSAS